MRKPSPVAAIAAALPDADHANPFRPTDAKMPPKYTQRAALTTEEGALRGLEALSDALADGRARFPGGFYLLRTRRPDECGTYGYAIGALHQAPAEGWWRISRHLNKNGNWHEERIRNV